MGPPRRALSPDYLAFQPSRVPHFVDVLKFSEAVGLLADRGELMDSAGDSTSHILGGIASSSLTPRPRKKKTKVRFHSNDSRKSDSGYLFFPLTQAYLEDKRIGTSRRIKAYCKALGISGRWPANKTALFQQFVRRSTKLSRPETAPDGKSWSDWSYELGS